MQSNTKHSVLKGKGVQIQRGQNNIQYKSENTDTSSRQVIDYSI